MVVDGVLAMPNGGGAMTGPSENAGLGRKPVDAGSLSPPLRTIKGAPFAWLDKRTVRLIQDTCEDYGSGLAVYAALCIVASDNQSEEFQTTHQRIAGMSGFSERTVRARIQDLVRAGAVSVTTPKLKGPCTYRLLAFGNDCRSSGNDCRTFGNGEATSIADIRRIEESKNIPVPTSGENTNPPPGPPPPEVRMFVPKRRRL